MGNVFKQTAINYFSDKNRNNYMSSQTCSDCLSRNAILVWLLGNNQGQPPVVCM